MYQNSDTHCKYFDVENTVFNCVSDNTTLKYSDYNPVVMVIISSDSFQITTLTHTVRLEYFNKKE